MNTNNPPTYHNGNYYLNVEDSLGNVNPIGQFECAASYNKFKINDENNILYKNVEPINKKNIKDMGYDSTSIANVEEGFTNPKSNDNKRNKCTTCKGIKWSWIILLLLVIVLFMIMICWKI
jgi:hypothetical protein